jgi:Protein of unknown function (DUF1566)
MPNSYFKLDANGIKLPVDATGHHAVQIENPLLAAPIIVTAHRSPKRLKWKPATKWAESLTTNDWRWRLATDEEGFFLPDRTRYPAYDANFFPDCDGEAIWLSRPAAYSPAGFAWIVYFSYGLSRWNVQSHECFVRAVRSSQ